MGFVVNNTGVGTGAFPASITPMPSKLTMPENYINFHDAGMEQWTQQYLPELYEQEVERYGNRTLSGFLRMVGAEMPMTSDQVIWSEQNRLHIAYDTVVITGGAGSNTFQITLPGTATQHTLRNNNTIVAYDPATGTTLKGIVTSDNAGAGAGVAPTTDFDAVCYTAGSWAPLDAAANIRLFVYGSDFQKGTVGMGGGIDPVLTTFVNKPTIIKDQYYK